MHMDPESRKDQSADLSGKLCIITGGTSGIGKETAMGLAMLGGEVTIVGRSKEKCEKVRNEITSATSNREITCEVADLSSMDSVRKLAGNIATDKGRIDVLINNAGGIFSKYILTGDGFESTISLDYLSPVLLTRFLLPALKLSHDAKIINIGSSVHKGGKPEFDFKYPWRYGAMKAYSTSKLMRISKNSPY
jgi:NAD(P)-dependent dehydrogenase (short-subunit alcohol dehydrogenase family)